MGNYGYSVHFVWLDQTFDWTIEWSRCVHIVCFIDIVVDIDINRQIIPEIILVLVELSKFLLYFEKKETVTSFSFDIGSRYFREQNLAPHITSK